MNPAAATRRYAARVATMGTATVVAQAILAATWVGLTRLFTPAEIGLFNVYFAIANVVGVVACLRFDMAVMLPRSHRAAAYVVILAIGFAMATAVIALALVAIGGAWLATAIGAPPLAGLLWLLPAAVLLRGTYQSLNYWVTRHERLGHAAVARVAQQVAAGAAQLGGGALALGPVVLAAGHALGFLAATGAVLRGAAALVVPLRRRGLGRRLKATARRHRRFPRYDVGAALLDVASLELPVLLVGAFFAIAIAGQFGLAVRVAALPTALAAAAIGQVFYLRATEEFRRTGTTAEALRDTLRGLIWVGVPGYAILAAFGPSLLAFVFGEPWRPAGLYASTLAPLYFMALLTGPVSQVFFVYGRQRRLLLYQAFSVAAAVLGMGLGVAQGDVMTGIVAYVALATLRNIVMAIEIFGLAGLGLADMLPPLRRA